MKNALSRLCAVTLSATLIFGMVLSPSPFSATPRASAADDCSSYDPSATYSDAVLRVLLAACQADIDATNKQLKAQRDKSSTIAGDVATLDALIKKATKQISIKNQIIAQLGKQIAQKQTTIVTLSGKLDREHASLAQILRKKNEIDNTTLTEMLLSNSRVSDFFLDVDNFEVVNKALQDSVNTVKGVRKETDDQKTALEKQKIEQANLKLQIEQQKKLTEIQQNDKKVLLANSKQQEKSYQDVLSERQAQAGKISAALFKLAGGSKAIPFGDAYRYAKVASSKTGVSPAFILAILKQESNLGTDQGGCYLTDPSTGTGTRVRNGEIIAKVMKAPRDTVPFQKILAALGYPIASTQVSCPVKENGAYMGYGGAMGPTQFIPSTWIGVADRVASALGEKASNPWDPQDAVMATAIFTKDLGASSGAAGEKTAACKYYSGHGCTGGGASAYGSSVMKIKAALQKDIDIIESAG